MKKPVGYIIIFILLVGVLYFTITDMINGNPELLIQLVLIFSMFGLASLFEKLGKYYLAVVTVIIFGIALILYRLLLTELDAFNIVFSFTIIYILVRQVLRYLTILKQKQSNLSITNNNDHL